MFTNATVTIKRRKETNSQTSGYKQVAVTETVIITDFPCLFSLNPSGREVYKEGRREVSKQTPRISIYDDFTGLIQTGDQAAVVCNGVNYEYTVNAAHKTQSLTVYHWKLELESVNLPT